MNALAVPARIDVDNAVEVLETLSQALAASLPEAAVGAVPPLALNIATLEHFDSSALSLLLQLARNHVQVGDNSVGDANREQAPPLFFLIRRRSCANWRNCTAWKRCSLVHKEPGARFPAEFERGCTGLGRTVA